MLNYGGETEFIVLFYHVVLSQLFLPKETKSNANLRIVVLFQGLRILKIQIKLNIWTIFDLLFFHYLYSQV